MSDTTLRVGFVPGVTPDKWARSWRERPGRTRLRLVPQEEAEAEAAVRSGDLDMALVRLPVERDDLHLVRLYDEVAVVVVAREHPIAAYDEIELADLAAEQFVGGPPGDLVPTVDQLDFPAMSAQEAVEVAAAGTGVVVLPMSVARLHHRKDVVAPTRPRTAADHDRPGLAGRPRRRAHPGLRRRRPWSHPSQLPRLTRSLFNQTVDNADDLGLRFLSTKQLRKGPWPISSPGSSPPWPIRPGATWWRG